MVIRKRPNKSKTLAVNKKNQSPGAKHKDRNNKEKERSTVNEDRRRAAKESGKVGKVPLTSEELGEKLYACLVPDCEETFDAWRAATRHMQNCDRGKRPEDAGKPRIYDSRKKANDLLEEGRAKVKTYPVPTEEEIVSAVREFYEQESTKDNQRKHAYQLVVVKKWGPGDFSRFGFGEFEEFGNRHGIATKE
jgi:hypothetical protein